MNPKLRAGKTRWVLHSSLRYKSATSARPSIRTGRNVTLLNCRPVQKNDNKNTSLSFTENNGSIGIEKELFFFIAKKDRHFRRIIFYI